MYKTLLRKIPLNWQKKLSLSLRCVMYEKELTVWLELCASLIKAAKVNTFQSGLALIRSQNKEPELLTDYITEVEASLVDGEDLLSALNCSPAKTAQNLFEVDYRPIAPSFVKALPQKDLEKILIAQATLDTAAFPDYSKRNHDWGYGPVESDEWDEEEEALLQEYENAESKEEILDFSNRLAEIHQMKSATSIPSGTQLDSKLCQLFEKILVRTSQENATYCAISWNDCDKPIEMADDFPFSDDDFAVMDTGKVYMNVEEEERLVFDIPEQLMTALVNIVLGLADLPYWEERGQKSSFTLTAEDEIYNLSLEYKPESKRLELHFGV